MIAIGPLSSKQITCGLPPPEQWQTAPNSGALKSSR
jgi:hypothetical protein